MERKRSWAEWLGGMLDREYVWMLLGAEDLDPSTIGAWCLTQGTLISLKSYLWSCSLSIFGYLIKESKYVFVQGSYWGEKDVFSAAALLFQAAIRNVIFLSLLPVCILCDFLNPWSSLRFLCLVIPSHHRLLCFALPHQYLLPLLLYLFLVVPLVDTTRVDWLISFSLFTL